MYVQIDKNFRDSLQENVIAKMYMGSHAHGLADDDSDEDILYIFYDINYGNTIFNETNGWQYKNGDIDENYQELRIFIRNLITGKVCCNLEALLDGWIFKQDNLNADCKSALDVIFNRLKNIRSYALVKSYLGYCKKDLKHARKMFDANCPLDSRDFRKKLVHAIRGVDTVGYLLNDSPYSFTRRSRGSIKAYASLLKRGGAITRETAEGLLDSNEQAMQTLRDKANDMLNSHTIMRRGDSTHLSSINSMLSTFVSSVDGEFSEIDFDDDLRLDIVEKGETHQYN